MLWHILLRESSESLQWSRRYFCRGKEEQKLEKLNNGLMGA